MAEGFLKYFGKDKVDAFSAGVAPTPEVNPLAIEVMGEIGIDISQNKTKPINQFLKQEFDFVITVCDNARRLCPVFPRQTKTIHWNIKDPAEAKGSREEQLEIFRNVREIIQKKILDFLKTF